MYREVSAPPGLPGARIWFRRVTGPGPVRVLPDGCLDLMWVSGAPGEGRLIVAGPDSTANLTRAPVGTEFVGLRFAPGTGAAVLGVPANEVRDARPDLADLWPRAEVDRLAERLATDPAKGRALADAALCRFRDPGPGVPAMVRALRSGLPVAELAWHIGLSERQLHRRCLALFGYGPKTLARVLRFDRALALARRGTALAAVAASTGYADQAHLARESRALAGVPLTSLLPRRG